jgi:hypothetical protein
MATLKELVYDELSTIKGSSRYSDDSTITIEHLEFVNINIRAFLIRQDLNKGRSLSDNIVQVLPCVPVISIDVSECPCTVPTDCTIMRTKDKIPKPIELHQRDLITRVSGVDLRGKGFSIISYARAASAGLNRSTSTSTKAFLHNQYIYLINPPAGLSIISISLVAEDPREAGTFANCAGELCYTDDSTFPISVHMIPTLKELVFKDLKVEISVPQDVIGNESNKSESQNIK